MKGQSGGRPCLTITTRCACRPIDSRVTARPPPPPPLPPPQARTDSGAAGGKGRRYRNLGHGGMKAAVGGAELLLDHESNDTLEDRSGVQGVSNRETQQGQTRGTSIDGDLGARVEGGGAVSMRQKGGTRI